MAAKNYTIKLTDNGDNGSGPYTGELIDGATVTGGTSKLTVGSATTTLGPGEVVNTLMERFRNLISDSSD